jgi:nitroreductase
MQVIECMRSRTSVREYKPDPIKEKDIEEIIETATQSPSAGNVQDWEFVVVKNPDTKFKIAKAAWEQDFITRAPVLIVVCSDIDRISAAHGNRGETLYSIQDTAVAVHAIMLAAWDRKIGSCWIGTFNEAAIRDILVMPTNIRPLAIIALGYPLKITKKPERRNPKEVTHIEKWE